MARKLRRQIKGHVAGVARGAVDQHQVGRILWAHDHRMNGVAVDLDDLTLGGKGRFGTGLVRAGAVIGIGPETDQQNREDHKGFNGQCHSYQTAWIDRLH